MEDIVMNGLVEISAAESTLIYGGRDEEVAKVVEFVAQCVGALAKILYLTAKRGPRAITEQMASGYYPKF